MVKWDFLVTWCNSFVPFILFCCLNYDDYDALRNRSCVIGGNNESVHMDFITCCLNKSLICWTKLCLLQLRVPVQLFRLPLISWPNKPRLCLLFLAAAPSSSLACRISHCNYRLPTFTIQSLFKYRSSSQCFTYFATLLTERMTNRKWTMERNGKTERTSWDCALFSKPIFIVLYSSQKQLSWIKC